MKFWGTWRIARSFWRAFIASKINYEKSATNFSNALIRKLVNRMMIKEELVCRYIQRLTNILPTLLIWAVISNYT
jgi:hypothetical protein